MNIKKNKGTNYKCEIDALVELLNPMECTNSRKVSVRQPLAGIRMTSEASYKNATARTTPALIN